MTETNYEKKWSLTPFDQPIIIKMTLSRNWFRMPVGECHKHIFEYLRKKYVIILACRLFVIELITFFWLKCSHFPLFLCNRISSTEPNVVYVTLKFINRLNYHNLWVTEISKMHIRSRTMHQQHNPFHA